LLKISLILSLKILVFRIYSIFLKILIRICKLEQHYFLGRKTQRAKKIDLSPLHDCNQNHPSVDVIISAYKGISFFPILINSIGTNICPKTTFYILLIDYQKEELQQFTEFLNKENIHVHCFSEKITIYKAWNFGISLGRGDLITNLNLDDLRRPNSICFLAKHFSDEKNLDVVYGDSIIVTRNPPENWGNLDVKFRRTLVGEFSLKDLLFYGNNKPHCAPMWRRSLHARIGMFNEDFVTSSDSDFWLRSLIAGVKFKYVSDVVVAYFLNPSGLSSSWNSSGFKEWNLILINYLKKILTRYSE